MDNKEMSSDTSIENPNIEVISIQSLCRLCSSPDERLISVFGDEGISNNLADKINSYLPIKISITDELPLQCCLNCTTTVLAWHDLVQATVESDRKFRTTPFLKNMTVTDELDIAEDQEKEMISPSLPPSLTDFCQTSQTFDNTPTTPESPSKKSPKIKMKADIVAVYPPEPIDSYITGIEPDFIIDSTLESREFKLDLHEELDIKNEDIKSEPLVKQEQTKRRHTKIDTDVANAAKVVVDGRIYYNCKECGKSLHSPYTYIWHMRIHTGERPYVCDLCGKQFRVSQGLIRHLRETHEGIKKFPCDLCGRMFATRRNVEEHRRIHTNERPYVCDLCGKAFKQKASLFVHKRSHKNYFPFKCSYCNQGFRTKPPLMVHITRHTGEKPYKCDVCGRCFRIKYELKRHRLIHSDEKPFVCSLCGLCFKQNRYLRNHQKSNHNVEGTA